MGMNPQRILIHAAAVADGSGLYAAPGAVLVEGEQILAAGKPEMIGVAADAHVRSLHDCVIIPALVNVHAHLDLTHIGPVEYGGDFTQWVDRLRSERARSDEGIAASVREGVRLAQAGGTALIGDIAGVRSTVPMLTLRETGLAGVSFLEVFGVGRSQAAAIEVMRHAIETIPALRNGVRFGLQPHAPYSCGPEVYRAAAAMQHDGNAMPLCTHLAETREEIEFVDRAEGALAAMLKRLGVWDESICGFGVHPIDHVAALWPTSSFIAAHVNYIDEAHLEALAQLNVTVAYCPRASAYFGHGCKSSAPHAPHPHRYRDMLARGINVALGTDSILCLDTAGRISVLDDMRLLARCDGVDAQTLLRMATINGARALGARESLFTLRPGESAGLLALPIADSLARDALAQVMRGNDAPRWVVGPIQGRDDWFETR
jgi:cytosine/adenosine deaminase-related metal-dependent hydrolase